MSYGWRLNNGNQFVASGNGPCNGKGSSLNAESAGMLAVTVFLGMLQDSLGFARIPWDSPGFARIR